MAQKKVYPSQINTKSIACRLPFEEWNKINSECIESGITINDWLLNKIYGQNQKIGTINSDKTITRDDVYEFIVEKHMSGNDNNPIPDTCKYLWKWFVSVTENKKNQSITINEFLELIRLMVIDIEIGKHNEADPDDIMMQVNILLQYTDWDSKDQSKFRKEIKVLIDELRQEIDKNDSIKKAIYTGELWYKKFGHR